MTKTDQVEDGMAQDQDDNGGDSKQGLGRYMGLIGGLLIIAGAVVSLAMALNKVRKLALWLIPVILYVAGVFLVAEPLAKRKAKIAATQEEIIALLDQLDPVAKVQVAKYVAESEFAKS